MHEAIAHIPKGSSVGGPFLLGLAILAPLCCCFPHKAEVHGLKREQRPGLPP
jgi:hypothetical protein